MEETNRNLSNYESAIRALNGLQSNVTVLNLMKQRRQLRPEANVLETAKYLERTGIETSDLDRLNVIHVAGTKGKGSVCALTESILRSQGLKTGFYSSPHLIQVRERIRINGEPLSEEKFASYFWKVFDRLTENKKEAMDPENDFQSMPAYFKFLTIMSFHVFLAEKVDVAVVEVGIGGAYDCTNVIPNPIVCGITTLDYDHTGILGETIEQIAWQKAGIMKPGSIAVTMNQESTALEVLAQRSEELKCPLFRCPPLASYLTPDNPDLKLGVPGRQQLENASLALQLSRLWMKRRRQDASFIPKTINSIQLATLEPFALSPSEAKALNDCRWPGRNQTLERGTTTVYVDGAHTPKSMEFCAEWFDESISKLDIPRDDIVRVLVFNCTSDRKPESLLRYLVELDFDCALFCPNMIYTEVDMKSDQAKMIVSHEKAMERCEESRRAWLTLQSSSSNSSTIDNQSISSSNDNRHALSVVARPASPGAATLLRTEFATAPDWHDHLPDASLEFTNFDHWTRSNGVCPSSNRVTAVFPCISSTLKWLETLEKRMDSTITSEEAVSTGGGRRLQVLITGSLHLVGGVLSILDPELKSSRC